jgi:SNF2 family DNA or RNA helicase
MALANEEIESLSTRLKLGAGHEAQDRTVAVALRSLLGEEKRGIVLADEVGFGKTYEALAIMALLSERAREVHKSFDRVLVLCKSSLLEKWQEELSSTRPERGFPRYLVGEPWHDGHPVKRLLHKLRVIGRRASGDELRSVREDGKLQASDGIYVVNQDVLTPKNREHRFFLRRLYETVWDLIIVDEAHHYARWTQPSYIFAPNGDLTEYDQGISNGKFGKILALTATPFELVPNEMVRLLALVRTDKDDLEQIKRGLDLYVERLDHFFSLRQRSQNDPLRREAVRRLKQLREDDALGTGGHAAGLQALLRKYVIRNMKSQNERKYFLVNKVARDYEFSQFEKLEDLHKKLRDSPLLPFDGADVLFYLELREVIEDKNQQAREGTDHRTFITTDLRQGLSSYPQILKSALLGGNLESARRLKQLVESWTSGKRQRLHPKVQALSDLVALTAVYEIEKVRKDPSKWFSKVLVFNKLIGGTAPHIRQVLSDRLDPLFSDRLGELLREKRWGSRADLASKVRSSLRRALDTIRDGMLGAHFRIPDEYRHEDFVRHRGRYLVDAYRSTILERTEQSLFLLRAAMEVESQSDEALRQWLDTEVTGPFEKTLRHVVDYYLGDQPGENRPREELVDMAERECVVLLEEYKSVELVGRYDGANSRDREAHRRNFNGLFNPFVLLVSRVGEEGIDLQKQCRYIIHYDLEWNPARMEQREGRVDRVGWGRVDEGHIDVRFMLLKGTYEERIFHAVMQRDQWFQVLIGSKRKELGKADDDELAMKPEDVDDGPVDVPDETGHLTEEEKAAVMIDLRPTHGQVSGN